jgi:hypothetical protein
MEFKDVEKSGWEMKKEQFELNLKKVNLNEI